MNEIVNKFLLTGDKFIPEMHLSQPRFIYRAYGPFTKKKERIQKIKETGDSRCIYENKQDKACFQYNMAYGDFQDLSRKTAHTIKLLTLLKIWWISAWACINCL